MGNPAHRVVEVASVVPITSVASPDSHGEEDFQRRRRKAHGVKDLEGGDDIIDPISSKMPEGRERTQSVGSEEVTPVVPTNYPFFHLDLDDAVRSAERAPIV